MERTDNIHDCSQDNSLGFVAIAVAAVVGTALAITAAVGAGMAAIKKGNGGFISNFAKAFVEGEMNTSKDNVDVENNWDSTGINEDEDVDEINPDNTNPDDIAHDMDNDDCIDYL